MSKQKKTKYWVADDEDRKQYVYPYKPRACRYDDSWLATVTPYELEGDDRLDLGPDWRKSRRRVEKVDGKWVLKPKKENTTCTQ